MTDFIFVGLAVVPAVLVRFDQIGLAIMAFVPMLIAGCLCGWHEQVTDTAQTEAEEAADETKRTQIS